MYEKLFRLGGIGNIKRRERNIEFESCFFFIYIEEGICGGNGENFLKS